MLLSITAGMSFEASAATYEKISNLKVPRFIQYYSNKKGDGSCWLASFASIDCYRRGNTYNGKTYSFGKDYDHDDALYKYLFKKNGNNVAWPGASSSLYKDEKISLHNSYSLSALYKALKAGKPVVIYSYDAPHASVVIGHKKSASSLSADNFVVMDVSQGYSQDKCYVSLSSWIKRCGTPSVMWYQDETPVTTCTGTFNFNANGGSGSMSSMTVKSGNNFKVPKCTFTRTGYTFAGWNAYRHSDGKWYTVSNKWQTASAISSNGYSKKLYNDACSGAFDGSWFESGKTAETYTFYAIWKACSHSNTALYEYQKATCTLNGYYKYRCSDCGYTYSKTISATGHSYDSGVVTKQPTVNSTGVKTYTCKNCGATKTETIPKLTLTGWQKIDGIYYYYNSDGTQKTGWIKDDNGKWHYIIQMERQPQIGIR